MTTFSTIQLRVIVFYIFHSFVCLLTGVCVCVTSFIYLGEGTECQRATFQGSVLSFYLV